MSLTQNNKFLPRIKRFAYILPVRLFKFQRPKWRRLVVKLRRSQVRRKYFLRTYSHTPFDYKIRELNKRTPYLTPLQQHLLETQQERLKKVKSARFAAQRKKRGLKGRAAYSRKLNRHTLGNFYSSKFSYRFFFKCRKQQQKQNKPFRGRFNRRKVKRVPYNKFFPTVIGLRRAKTKFSYKWSLWLKRELFLFFNNELTLKHYKKILNKMSLLTRKSVMLELFIRPFFQLNILLWKLGLFKTVATMRQFFLDKLILVNNGSVHGALLLKKGDFVTLSGCNFNLLPARKKFLKTRKFVSRFSAYQLKVTPNLFSSSMGKITFLWSIVEIDYFTNTFILLIDYQECTKEMLPFLLRADLLNIFLFLKYIKNK